MDSIDLKKSSKLYLNMINIDLSSMKDLSQRIEDSLSYSFSSDFSDVDFVKSEIVYAKKLLDSLSSNVLSLREVLKELDSLCKA